jgi:3-oxoacyl-[acyl-carrier protein] reductase
MDLQLKDKTCLVTGASAGIGTGIARVMAREGVRLAILARRRDPMEALADEIAAETGARPTVVVADLMQQDAPAAVRAAVGDLDILINNAGLSSRPDPMAPDEVWNAGFDLKFTTVRRLTNAFLPTMRARRWGRIINVTGIIEPLATSAALTACAAVHAWAKGCRAIWRARGSPSTACRPAASTASRSASGCIPTRRRSSATSSSSSRSAASASPRSSPTWSRS